MKEWEQARQQKKKEMERLNKEKEEMAAKTSKETNLMEKETPLPGCSNSTKAPENSKQSSILDTLVKDDVTNSEKAEAKEIEAISEEPSELAKTIKNRRMQVELNKQEMERKEKENKERLVIY